MLPLQLILDPSSLALTSMGNTREDALEYIEEILTWDQLGSKAFGIAITSQETWIALSEDKQLPDEKSLQKRLVECNVQEHHAYDIIRQIHNIIWRGPYLEDVEITPQEDKIIPPNNYVHFQGPNMRRIFSRIIGILSQKSLESDDILSVIAQKITDERTWPPNNTPKGETNKTAPAILLAKNYQNFLQHINIAKIISFQPRPFEKNEIALILKLIYDRHTGTKTPSIDIADYNIGPRFIERMNSLNLTPNITGKLITVMAETLLEINLTAAHRLRRDSSGGSPPRKRKADGALAWRRDIDREHHLHYWKGEKGHVEFSWVSFPHDDFICPE